MCIICIMPNLGCMRLIRLDSFIRPLVVVSTLIYFIFDFMMSYLTLRTRVSFFVYMLCLLCMPGAFFSLYADTPVEALQAVGVEVVRNPRVQTEQDDRITPEDPATVSQDIDFWWDRLPSADDVYLPRYIVIPRLGVVAPINNIYPDNPDYARIQEGRDFDVNAYLQEGVLRYPFTGKP